MQTKTRLDRQWMLINELSDSTEGKTIAELSLKLGMPRSTLFIDLADLYSQGFPVHPICEKEICRWSLREIVPIELTLNLTELLLVYFIIQNTPIGRYDDFEGAYSGAYTKIKALLERIGAFSYASHCISHGCGFVEPTGPYKDFISIIEMNTYEQGQIDCHYSNVLNTAEELSHLEDDSTYQKGENKNDPESDVSELECSS